jgi:hypothetical protein
MTLIQGLDIIKATGLEREVATASLQPWLDTWAEETRKVQNPEAGLRVLCDSIPFDDGQRLYILRGMLTLNLILFLLNMGGRGKINIPEWRKEMLKLNFMPAVVMGIGNETFADMAAEILKKLNPQYTEEDYRLRTIPEPEDLLSVLIERWCPDEPSKVLFLLGWAIYDITVETQAKKTKKAPVNVSKGSNVHKPVEMSFEEFRKNLNIKKTQTVSSDKSD